MRLILFDFGGTLDADGTSWIDRFWPIYREAGVAVERRDFDRAFYHADDHLPTRHRLAGLSLEETLNIQVARVLEQFSGVPRPREQIVSRFLADCRAHFRRNRPVLERLAARHRLGVVSNFYGNLEGILAAEGLRDLFGAVADSGVVGAEKPKPALFLHALATLGGSPDEALMVGDSLPRDMKGAEGLGMTHAFLNPAGGRCCEGAWSLRALPELEALLS